MKVLDGILSRHGLAAPDGRPLHAYGLTTEETAALRGMLPVRIRIGERLGSTAQGFVLWAAERIRRDWPGGPLSWEFVYRGLDLAPPDYGFTRWLVETGLKAWHRPLRRGDAGHREFLFSLLAEGGLPDAALNHPSRYRKVLLALIAEIEAEGALGPAVAVPAALRRVEDLPQVLRGGEQAQLLAELALGLVELRRALPEGLPPEAALAWLDAQRAGWRAGLPLRLSDAALEAIVRPALAAERGRPPAAAAPVRRELRRDGSGRWHGAAVFGDGAVLPEALVPRAAGLRLRLVSASGAALLAVPEAEGWRLMRSGGPAAMALDPWAPAVVSAHADGRPLGDLVLDPGLPAPEEAPTLWRAAEAGDDAPEVLVPLSGRGQTRSARLWLLTGPGARPEPGEGLELGAPEQAPGGLLWPVSGRGRLAVDGQALAIATGADAEAPLPRLAVFGPVLPGLAEDGGGPVHLGAPQVWAAEGEGGLRPLRPPQLRLRGLTGVLGGQIAEWVAEGAVLARLRLVVLPAAARLELTEAAEGTIRLRAAGLGAGWHLALSAGGDEARAVADGAGAADLALSAAGLPGLTTLRLSDPRSGAALALSGLWPARRPRLIAPDGAVLRQDREVSLSRLPGWRGHLPHGRGAVLMRLAGQGAQVGLPVAGEVRLAAHAGAAAQALALAGADGRVNLRVAAAGTETPRLSVGRYDWESEEAGPFRHLGAGRTRLRAVHLDDPARTAEVEAEGRIDPGGWLGEGEGLWFVQGVNEARGVMRSFVWAARPQPRGTRADRLTSYAAEWRRLLGNPGDPGWDRLWALITAVRALGDAGALDQVQALERAPAAAVALLLMAPRDGRAAALALETEAPLWWPLVPAQAWAQGLAAARDRLAGRLAEAGIEGAAETAGQAVARAAGEVVALRPELGAHLGQALAAAGLPPVVTDPSGRTVPLAAPPARLLSAAQEAARRFEQIPDGADGLRARRLAAPAIGDGRMDALLHAPLVAAEAAAGLRSALSAPDMLRLIALRAADPAWFEAALPCALTLAMEEARR